MVKIYMGPAVGVNWSHMQKGIKVSVPGSYWGGGINKIKNRTRGWFWYTMVVVPTVVPSFL